MNTINNKHQSHYSPHYPSHYPSHYRPHYRSKDLSKYLAQQASQPRSMMRSIVISLVLCLLISLILLALYWQNLYKNIPSPNSTQRTIHVEQMQDAEKVLALSQTESNNPTNPIDQLTHSADQFSDVTDDVTDNDMIDDDVMTDASQTNQALSVASQQALMDTLVLNDKDETKSTLDKHYLDNINEVLTPNHAPNNALSNESNNNKTNDTDPQHTVSNNSPNDDAMRVQTRHIPTSHKQKMTDLLPDELKQNIKQSLLSDEQVRSLNSEERKAYKRTQREIVRTLRELAGLEAENQQLKSMINEKEQTNESLNKEILALRQYFK